MNLLHGETEMRRLPLVHGHFHRRDTAKIRNLLLTPCEGEIVVSMTCLDWRPGDEISFVDRVRATIPYDPAVPFRRSPETDAPTLTEQDEDDRKWVDAYIVPAVAAINAQVGPRRVVAQIAARMVGAGQVVATVK